MYKKFRFSGVNKIFYVDQKTEGDLERNFILLNCENFEEFQQFEKFPNFFDQDLRIFCQCLKAKGGNRIKVDIGEILGQIGEGFVLLPVLDIQDIEIEEFFMEEEEDGEDFCEYLGKIDVILEENKQKKRLDLDNSEIFINEFVEFDRILPELETESDDFILPEQFDCISKLEIPNPEFFLNFNRTIFDISEKYSENIFLVQDIRLRKKELAEINIKSDFSDQIPTNLSIPGVKITMINSISDLEKLKIEKKNISFSLEHEQSSYCQEESLTQIQKVPIKVFYDHSSQLAQYLLDLIVMEKFNVIGLETPSKLIAGVDLILTWQTAVKIIPDTEVKDYENIKDYLKTIHFGLIKFDTLLLVLYGKGFYSDISAGETVELYSEYLLQFGVNCKVLKTDSLDAVEWCIKDYLLRYMAQITDLGVWVEIQEKISDLHPKIVDDEFNIYTLHVIYACKSHDSSELTKICNCLGTNNYKKYESILKYYKKLGL